MPYKFNEGRRHKFPKARYRVTNWPDYDAALVRRGELTVWLTEEALEAWYAPATGERGGQPIYWFCHVSRRLQHVARPESSDYAICMIPIAMRACWW